MRRETIYAEVAIVKELEFGRDSEAGSGVGKLYSEKGRFQRCLMGNCWQQGAGGGLTRSKASYMIGVGVVYLAFLVGPKFLRLRLRLIKL